MEADQLLQELRQKFAEWFVKDGFQLVYQQVGRNDNVVFGLESPSCRLSIEQEDGIIVIMIGSPTSRFGENDYVNGVKEWVNLERVVDFFAQQPFDWKVDDRLIDGLDKLDYLAKKILPFWQNLRPMFNDWATMKHWYDQYDQYATEQIELQWRSTGV